jgi:hypothetical protein
MVVVEMSLRVIDFVLVGDGRLLAHLMGCNALLYLLINNSIPIVMSAHDACAYLTSRSRSSHELLNGLNARFAVSSPADITTYRSC